MKKTSDNPILKLRPLHRVMICFVVAAAVFFIVRSFELEPLVTAVFGWIAFAITYLSLDWIIILKRSVEQIQEMAKKDDGSVVFVFFIVLLAAFASMFAVLFLTVSKEKSNETLTVIASVVAMLLSWAMVHTQYIFHYAHEYYDDDDEGSGEKAEGLDFPGDEDPDYMDFAYFSFCLGSTFQVSDVDITSKLIRKIVFVHGLLAFFMNTFVVALTINIVAGLSDG